MHQHKIEKTWQKTVYNAYGSYLPSDIQRSQAHVCLNENESEIVLKGRRREATQREIERKDKKGREPMEGEKDNKNA